MGGRCCGRSNRKALINPTIAAHHGRIVKTTGDDMLVEFASVVDAVTCSVAIQRAIITRNAGVPEDKRIRVGISGARNAGRWSASRLQPWNSSRS
jgi:adenylate cyclase